MTVTAVILCGGQGTRVKHLLGDIPKCLYPVGGRPFIKYVLDHLASQKVREVVLCTGVGHEQVRDALGYRHQTPIPELGPHPHTLWNMNLSYSVEREPLGTARALYKALPIIQGDRVLVLNGDTYCPFDLGKVQYFHEEYHTNPLTLLVRSGDSLSTGVSYQHRGVLEGLMEGDQWRVRQAQGVGLGGHTFVDIGTPEGLQGAEGSLRSMGMVE